MLGFFLVCRRVTNFEVEAILFPIFMIFTILFLLHNLSSAGSLSPRLQDRVTAVVAPMSQRVGSSVLLPGMALCRKILKTQDITQDLATPRPPVTLTGTQVGARVLAAHTYFHEGVNQGCICDRFNR